MNPGLYLLRAFQVGLTMADLEQLEQADVMDMLIEAGNDDYPFKEKATQADFDRFAGRR